MDGKTSEVLQGTLDLMILKTLHALGPLHGFGIARRIEQVSRDVLQLNEGTVYTSLLRLQQQGWIAAEWGTSENNRKAKFYSITRRGREAARGGNGELGAHFRCDWPRAAAGTGGIVMRSRRESRAARVRGEAARFSARTRNVTMGSMTRSRNTCGCSRTDSWRRGCPGKRPRRPRDGSSATPPCCRRTAETCRRSRRSRRGGTTCGTRCASLWKERGFAVGVDRHAGIGHRRGDGDFQRDLQRAAGALSRTGTRTAWYFRGSRTCSRGRQSGRQGYTATEVLEFAENSQSFDGIIAAPGESACVYRHGAGTEQLSGALVTPGTFEFFGMPALHGRVMQPGDYEPGAPPVFVMRHKTWMTRFNGDLSLLDKTFVLNGTARTLVGIMPPRFGWYGADVWIPEKLRREATTGSPTLPEMVPAGTPEAGRVDRSRRRRT